MVAGEITGYMNKESDRGVTDLGTRYLQGTEPPILHKSLSFS